MTTNESAEAINQQQSIKLRTARAGEAAARRAELLKLLEVRRQLLRKEGVVVGLGALGALTELRIDRRHEFLDFC